MSVSWILIAAALALYRFLRPARTAAAAAPVANAPDPVDPRVEAGQHA